MIPNTLIAVDIGNNSTKIGWGFDLSGSVTPPPNETYCFRTGQIPADELSSVLPRGSYRWRIASVHRQGTQILLDWLAQHRPDDAKHVLTYRDLPIKVCTNAPEKVGVDRLAAAVCANMGRLEENPAIIVDAGSAITVDLVHRDGSFQGGVILPGFRMTAEALHGADLLPLIEFVPEQEPPSVVGKDTGGAIRSGLFWGAVGAVREVIARITSELDGEPALFVTGGDLRKLYPFLMPGACFLPDMVLTGIALADMQR